MKSLGIILFGAGSIMLLVFAVIGISAGQNGSNIGGNVAYLAGNVTNLAGDIVGLALMLSGAIFIVGGRIEEILLGNKLQVSKMKEEVRPELEEKANPEGKAEAIRSASSGELLALVGGILACLMFVCFYYFYVIAG